MVAATENLGEDFDFVRIDLHCLESAPKFGGMTFTPEAGWGSFIPERKYDFEVGKLW